MNRRRFDRQGFLVLDPRAFFELYIQSSEPENRRIGDTEIVEVRGALVHHFDRWFDSYEAIAERVAVACKGTASSIVLRIDSTGGELSGCFETTRAIRAMCTAAGKRLVAYVEGHACSGGYALACAAERIAVAETAVLGSIGVLNTRLDTTVADASMGLTYSLVASGARKTDGYPHAKLTEAETEATRTIVNSLAGVFFELVAEMRGTTVEAVAALEAGLFHGDGAIAAGLADQVQSFDALIASLANGGGDNMAEEKETEKEERQASAADIDSARAALERAAEGDDEYAERARRALAALDAAEEEASEEASSNAARAAVAPTVSAGTAGDLAATVTRLSASVEALQRQNEELERAQFLASRPDISKELLGVLRTKPITEVKAIVNAIPKPETAKPAATTTVAATRGKTQGGGAHGATAPTNESGRGEEMDRRMGLAASAGGVRREGNSLIISPPFGGNAAARTADAGKGAAKS